MTDFHTEIFDSIKRFTLCSVILMGIINQSLFKEAKKKKKKVWFSRKRLQVAGPVSSAHGDLKSLREHKHKTWSGTRRSEPQLCFLQNWQDFWFQEGNLGVREAKRGNENSIKTPDTSRGLRSSETVQPRLSGAQLRLPFGPRAPSSMSNYLSTSTRRWNYRSHLAARENAVPCGSVRNIYHIYGSLLRDASKVEPLRQDDECAIVEKYLLF